MGGSLSSYLMQIEGTVILGYNVICRVIAHLLNCNIQVSATILNMKTQQETCLADSKIIKNWKIIKQINIKKKWLLEAVFVTTVTKQWHITNTTYQHYKMWPINWIPKLWKQLHFSLFTLWTNQIPDCHLKWPMGRGNLGSEQQPVSAAAARAKLPGYEKGTASPCRGP